MNDNHEDDQAIDDAEIHQAEEVKSDGGGGQGAHLVHRQEIFPRQLTIIPLTQKPLFPGTMFPLVLSGSSLINTVRLIIEKQNGLAGCVLIRNSEDDDGPAGVEYETVSDEEEGEETVFEEGAEDDGTYNEFIEERKISSEDLYGVGTLVRIHKFSELPVDEEDSPPMAQMLVQTMRRISCKSSTARDEMIVWDVEYEKDPKEKPSEELKAYTMAVISEVKELLKLNPLFQEQLKMLMNQLSFDNPGKIMDIIASMTSASPQQLQGVLEAFGLRRRAEKLMLILRKEIELSRIQEKIRKSIEERISKQQKKFFLQEQLKAIKKELGLEKDEKTAEIDKFKERLKKLKPSEEAQRVIDQEFDNFKLLEPASPEYHVSRNYLDWLTILPWGVHSEDSFDLPRAREILNRDHFGLDDLKSEILEFISVGRKRGKLGGSILCFVGPPGVGKTSVGRSIADAIGRKFFRFSVGGMRDEAEIKGHRRTYIGAMPGKFIQCMKSVGTCNPVIMLDEIDKIGTSFHGDPASALLEVLDPEQNKEFLDHYLDVRFDLREVLFIATANQLDTIPSPLLDRMVVLKLSGYIMEEKLEIARRYLLPRALEEYGFKEGEVNVDDSALRKIINDYAREAGVRNLEKQIRKLLRTLTLKMAEADKPAAAMTVSEKQLEEYLGLPLFPDEVLYNKSNIAGVALGLAWTSLGGATLYVEAARYFNDGGGYKQTGQLGDVMKESSQIAYSFVRSLLTRKNREASLEFFGKYMIHLHVPAGATPKDGPSAGITMALAIYSLATGKPVPPTFAMTGELTLTGKVLPIGGVKEKVIAAKRVNVFEVILPAENRRDYDDLPENIRSGMKAHFVEYFDDVLAAVYK